MQQVERGLVATTQAKDKMEGALLLDVVVGQGSTVLKLLASEDQSLLIWGNTFLVLDLLLDIVDGIRALNLKGDGLASESLDEDLHSSSESEDEMEGALLLDVVVGQGSAILELLSSEDQSLLIWWNSLLVLDLLLDIVDGVRALNLKGNCLSSEGLDEDLHSSSESEDEMKSAFFLYVVISQSSAVLELLSSEDQSLLIWWDSFLVLDLLLDIIDGIRALNLKGDGLASESLDEDLHSSSESEDEMESALLLDVVVGQGSAILELLSSEDQSLLIWRNSLLVLDLLLDIIDGVAGLDLESDGFSGESFDEDLHCR